MAELLWQPKQKDIVASNIMKFIAYVEKEFSFSGGDYWSLYRWSVENTEEFWQGLWQFCEIKASRSWDKVLVDGDKMPGAKWFTGARLNFAENLLRCRNDAPAIIFRSEAGHDQQISFHELYRQSMAVVRSLRAYGIKQGDFVVGFMPNIPQTIIAMLGAATIGAVWSSCSPDFGINGVLDRFGQIKPKLIFSADGYQYGGKYFDSMEKLAGITGQLPSIEKIVIIPYIKEDPNLSNLPAAQLWQEFLLATEEIPSFEQLPFDHPLYVMYSSGTTGIPKCIVHGAGGTLLQHMKEHCLHNNLAQGDRLFYFTTCGWMMWNWLVSALALGTTIMLYDGSPVHPKPDVLFDFAEQKRMNIFGTSAKYIASIEKLGLKPGQSHDLSQLKAILSTGSPLVAENYDYVYREIKSDLRLSSITGGTDLISCFALGNPVLPVIRGEIQCRGLAMDVEVYDDQAKVIREEKGELVCRKPFPSMPISFWNDEDGRKYHNAYFNHFDNIWRHGDWAEITENNGMIIYGRSDAVLNAGGIRIGTAEIYRTVEQFAEIAEALAIGQKWQGDERIILFVRMQKNHQLDYALTETIKSKIRKENSPRHVPAHIIAVADIPRTISGKIVELAVKNIIHGKEVKNIDALANPQSLELFKNIVQLSQ